MSDAAPEQTNKTKTRIRVVNFAKLAMAIGALATAITGYVEVRRNQDNLLQAVSDKVNAMALKMAYLEGRIDGLNPKDAAKEASLKVQPAPAVPHHFTVNPKIDEDGVPDKLAAVMSPDLLPPPEPEVQKADAQVYRQMPRNFQALQEAIDSKVATIDLKAAALDSGGNL